jgi:RimJ/RimL family protein N-acetyltransferase
VEQAIKTSRLLLVSMGAEIMEAFLAEDRLAAARMLGCTIPTDFSLKSMPLAIRLAQLRANPDLEPWLLRAMIDRASGTMIGHIGFHSSPRPRYLAEFAPDGVELGYTVHPGFRRRRYATEAVLALMHWAYMQHMQRCFVLSISAQNLPSTAMAQSLGFLECGSQVDDVDGPEIVFARRFKKWPADWRLDVVE